MIQLACNYSPQLLALLDNRRARLDWIKLSRRSTVWEEIALCEPYAPMLLHTLPHATMTGLDSDDFSEINRALAACRSPHIALHCSALPEDWGHAELADEEVVDLLAAGVRRWKRELKNELLIENVPYYADRGTSCVATDPETTQPLPGRRCRPAAGSGPCPCVRLSARGGYR